MPDGVIYLDGNSLGPLPSTTQARLAHVIGHEWGTDLIRSWNTAGWIDQPLAVGNRLAPLLGASPGTVVTAESTTIALTKIVSAAMGLVDAGRRVVVTERGNFPTDAHVLSALATVRGIELRTVDRDFVLAAADEAGDDLALVCVTQVDYRTGHVHDLAELAIAAHAAGGIAIFDLAHSAGALDLDLDADGVDFAVGCGYKYLNGGPGAPAFLYVHPRWVGDERLANPLPGWMGHADPFSMSETHVPAKGIARFITGTPPILGLAALDEGIATFDGVSMSDLRAKSIELTELFCALMNANNHQNFTLASPTDPNRRGSQVSYCHPEAYAIVQVLIAADVIGDFREPDIARFGFAPLYVRRVDVWDAVDRLATILQERHHERPEHRSRAKVT